MATRVASIGVGKLTSTATYVDKFQVEIFSDAGFTTRVGIATSAAVWNGTAWAQKDLILFTGLVFGNTYWLRAATVAPISGALSAFTTFNLVAGSATTPAPTYTIVSQTASYSGILYKVTPASAPVDLEHYEYTYTTDGSTPTSTTKPLGTVVPDGSGNLIIFAGALPTQTVNLYIRAVNMSQLVQAWTAPAVAMSPLANNVDNMANGSTYGRTPLGLTDNDGLLMSYGKSNLVFNPDLSIYTPPTGIRSTYASSIRANDNDNGGVAQNTPNGWTRNYEVTGNGDGVIYRKQLSSLSGAGSWSLVLEDKQGAVNCCFSAVSDAFPVVPGRAYFMSGKFNIGYGVNGLPTHGTWYFRVIFYKAGTTDFSRGSVGQSTVTASAQMSSVFTAGAGFASVPAAGIADLVSNSTASGIQTPAGIVTAPSDAAYARVAIYHWNDGTAPTLAWSMAASDITFAPAIDPSNTWMTTKGSTPPTVSTSNPFTYTSNSTSITISWSSFTIFRADGTTVTISSGSQAITGLTFAAPQQYNFFPYYDEALGTMVFMTRAGANGSPAIAYTLADPRNTQLQNLQGRIPLGTVTASTVASGTGSGSGGGGSTSGCLWHRCVVLHKEKGVVEMSDCEVGDWILGKNGRWTQIKTIEILECDEWVHAWFENGEGLRSTFGHPTPLIDGSVSRACNIGLGTYIPACELVDGEYKRDSVTHPVDVKLSREKDLIAYMVCDHEHDHDCAPDCGDGHLFYAGMALPRILTHNGILPSQ